MWLLFFPKKNFFGTLYWYTIKERIENDERGINMINFKKVHDDWWNGLPKEKQEAILRQRKLEEENIFYKTNTLLDDEYAMKHRKAERKEIKQEVKLYRPVYGNEVSKTMVLSFGGYREYGFDLKFCKKMLQDLKRNTDIRLCIDGGNEVYVKRSETVRIITEALKALKEKNMELIEDNHPSLTNSDMGKMLEGMGLR